MVIEKDRARTEQLVIDALGRVLASEGFQGVGVNRVAREAGVSKMLIYRYFGGLDGLVREYGHRGTFWPTFEEITEGLDPDEQDIAVCFGHVMERYIEGVRRRPQTLEILAWEMSETNELVRILEQTRESLGLQLLERFEPLFRSQTTVDANALTALFAGGIHYIACRARNTEHFNGVPVQVDEGWERFAAVMKHVMSALALERAAQEGEPPPDPRAPFLASM
ncbi:MAG: TetR/AcrR family transcriptional regulator [Planctomycetota bacterium]